MKVAVERSDCRNTTFIKSVPVKIIGTMLVIWFCFHLMADNIP